MNSWKLAAKAICNPGLKITNSSWIKNEYIYYSENCWLDQDNQIVKPSFNTRNNDYWYEYTKPKERVSVYKFAYKKVNEAFYQESQHYYENLDQFRECNPDYVHAILLPDSKIEVLKDL